MTAVLVPPIHILLENVELEFFPPLTAREVKGGSQRVFPRRNAVSTIKVSNRGTKNNRITTQDWGREVGVKHTIYHSQKAMDNGPLAKSIYVSILGREMEVPPVLKTPLAKCGFS